MVETQDLVRKVMSFPPPPLLIERFSAEHVCSANEARLAFDETKRFLFLCGTSNGQSLAPSQAIDTMWHEFMLFTRTYAGFCKEFFGMFIHHQPSDKPAILAYAHTRKRAVREFKALNLNYWPEKGAAAGLCYDPEGDGGDSGSHHCDSGGKCD